MNNGIFADDEIEDLLTTSTLKEMIREIKKEYCVSSYGVFSLQYSDGVEFYKDTEEINPNDEETKITLEEFFGNADGAEIIYVRTHHIFSRILNFLFLITFSRKELSF